MAHKLFIGGLSFSTSDERLRELFAVAGGVVRQFIDPARICGVGERVSEK
jgi:hypothetical protein